MKGRGIRKQWEEYYDKPGKRAESGSSTKAYATDEGKRVTHQLWQEAMGTNYQNVSALLDNQSMVNAAQNKGNILWLSLGANLAGLFQPEGYRSHSAMSDPFGGYAEIGEVREESAGGIRIGLLTYNDPSDTYSTYSGTNFDEAFRKRFGRPPGLGLESVTGPCLNQGWLITKGEAITPNPVKDMASLGTPQSGVPYPEPKAPLRPLLPSAELKDSTPAYNSNYTIQMLDILTFVPLGTAIYDCPGSIRVSTTCTMSRWSKA